MVELTLKAQPKGKLYTTQVKIDEALGTLADIKGDKVLDYLVTNANQLFTPKRFLPGDWLATQKERGQSFKVYKQGGPDISWSNSRYNTIILFFIDDTISPEHMKNYEEYCKAFYTGCNVKVLRPGDPVPGRAKGSKEKVPMNFLLANKIPYRENSYGT